MTSTKNFDRGKISVDKFTKRKKETYSSVFLKRKLIGIKEKESIINENSLLRAANQSLRERFDKTSEVFDVPLKTSYLECIQFRGNNEKKSLERLRNFQKHTKKLESK